MKADVFTLRKILDALAEKTGKSIDHAGLNDISEMVGQISTSYLYKKIYRVIEGKDDQAEISLGDFQLNQVLRYLGFASLAAFRESRLNPLNEILQSLSGNYYSYVRSNHKRGLILRSPVTITPEDGKLHFRLHGKNIHYHGVVASRHGCLFILMESGAGKSFHHIYKIGTRHSPHVLQGVFSGVSTAFDPIAGRALLVRQDQPAPLTNQKSEVETMLKSGDEESQCVATYFREYCNNNVSPNKSHGFGFDDLL